MYLQARFAYQRIITIYVHYHFNTLNSFEGIFPTLRMVLYKKTIICVLVHQQFKHRERRCNYDVWCDINIRAGATEPNRFAVSSRTYVRSSVWHSALM